MVTCYAASRAGVLVAHDVADAEDTAADPTAELTFESDSVECLDAGADSPDRVFCGTFDAGLHRSVDGGETWARVGADTLATSVTSVTVSPHDPDVVYAGTEPSGVYRSADGGTTWKELHELTALPSASEWAFPPRPDTHHVRWIEVDPGNPDHLYVAVEAGALIQTRDGGETWEERAPSTRRDTHTMAIHPDAPDRVRAAAGDGYAESDDSGETWSFPQAGLRHRYCWSVAVDPGDPGHVLLSAAASARRAHTPDAAASYLYRRRDPTVSGAGAGDADDRWERLDDSGVPTGEGVLRATLAPGVGDGELFALTDRGLFRTTTGGDAFERVAVDWPEAFRGTTTRGLAVVRTAE
ncbi:WD40/YVTN/BNR-like repeat-containing protein [Halobellus sp. GM3]|uniref:WD40/YVTN/BNR-like repeat-containing protein n=1 Tax=Halobellus sp. GM3 TaxID=3458410 RepID=UPI00403D6FF0